jgi:hypothetical protein
MGESGWPIGPYNGKGAKRAQKCKNETFLEQNGPKTQVNLDLAIERWANNKTFASLRKIVKKNSFNVPKKNLFSFYNL